jgi:hypothetical protein
LRPIITCRGTQRQGFQTDCGKNPAERIDEDLSGHAVDGTFRMMSVWAWMMIHFFVAAFQDCGRRNSEIMTNSYDNRESNALAAFKSPLSKPSVNQP